MPAGASGVCDAPCQERPGLGPDCGGGTLGSLDEERFGFSVGQCPASSQRGVGRWRAWTRSGSGSVLDSVLHPASGGWDTGEPGRGAVQVQRWTVSCIRPAGGGTLGSLDEERFGFSVGQGSVSCIRPAGGGTLGSLNEEQFGFSVGQCPASGQRATGRRVRCC